MTYYKIINKNILIVLLALLTACQQHYVPKSIPPLPPERKIKSPVNTALVLGAGGSKGMAHIGVLEELENAGIKVDLIVGCSAGSIVGALYAEHKNAKKLKTFLWNKRKKDLVDINMFSARYGLVSGCKLKDFLREHIKSTDFTQLQIPLRVVATDLTYGKKIVFSSGDIVSAVQASSAVPGVFQPVKYYGRLLVDGGVIDPLPIKEAKKHKPRVIIAVDIRSPLPDTLPKHLFGVIKRSMEIRYRSLSECERNQAQIIISPDLPNIGTFDDKSLKQSYLAGKIATRKALLKMCPKYKGLCRKNYQ